MFAVTQEQLGMAGGRVRCGHCFNPFNASDHLTEALPIDPPAKESAVESMVDGQSVPEMAPPQQHETLPTPLETNELTTDGTGLPEEDSSEALDEFAKEIGGSSAGPWEDGLAEDVPEVLERDLAGMTVVPVPWYQRLMQVVVLGVIVVFGVAQYAWFYPRELVRWFPAIQPVLQQGWPLLTPVFGWMERYSPQVGDADYVRLKQRDVRAHPKYKGMLLVTAAMVNVDPFPQRYPVVRFTLFDMNGARIASRDIIPEEYLAGGLDSEGVMPPGRPVQFRLELVAPHTEAVSFEFAFIQHKGSRTLLGKT
ncbi:MAG: DUF3426 domain-containing protein [Gammaproteobacteria bacterium]|nr:DUF3426 domain-containing protein [Gammaproteobacteria bacterium]